MAWLPNSVLLAFLMLQLAWPGGHAVGDAAQAHHSMDVGKTDPFAGYEGTYEGQCMHYAYGPVDESGRCICTESPVTYPIKWVITKESDQYKVTSIMDKTTIEHGDKTYLMPRIVFQDAPISHVHSDEYGHCVRIAFGGAMHGGLRIRVSMLGDDTVLHEDGHWHLSPMEDGELVSCPPKSTYVSPLACSADKNMFGYKCTSYKRG